MSETLLFQLVLLPLGLGLLGFVEPCSMGANLLFVKFLEAKSAAAKVGHVIVFGLTRAVFLGALGIAAVLAGTAFIGFQKFAWLALGLAYAGFGLFYIAGRGTILERTIGLRLSRISGRSGSATLGLLFGLNVPACAAPLIFALFGMAAAAGSAGMPIATGFASLALFGLALSLPLVLLVAHPPARAFLERLAGFSRRLPLLTGLVLLALGMWSVWFGLFVDPADWTLT